MVLKMTTYGVILLAVLSIANDFTEAVITSPADGGVIYGKLGENITIQWIFDDDIANVRYRSFSFNETLLYDILPSAQITPGTTLLFTNVDVVKPSSLIIKQAARNNGGKYKFSLTTTAGVYSTTVNVIVKEQPIAVLGCSTPYIVEEGHNISCLCNSSSGNPPPTASWYNKDGSLISSAALKNNLILTNVSNNEAGNYTCRVLSHDLENNKTLNITVKYKPIIESFTINSTLKYVVRGSSVLFTCKVDAYPSANVTLYHNGSKVGDFKNGKYIINAVNSAHNGNYQCVAENDVGNRTSGEVVVEVAEKPKASSNCTNTNNTVNEHGKISCTCGAGNNVSIAEAWWIDNEGYKLKPGSLLNRTLNREDDGTWTCHVRSYQNLTDKITIVIKVNYTDQTTLSTTVPAVIVSSTATTKGTTTSSTGMSTGAIVGIAVGAVFAVALFIAILWLLCCKKGKEKQSAAAYKPSMMENPYESPDQMMGDGDTADGQDSAGSSRPSTTGANPAPQAGGLPPVYAVVDKSRVTHNKKPEVDPSQVTYASQDPSQLTYASLDPVALQPDSSRMHERPQVESNYASIDLGKLGKL